MDLYFTLSVFVWAFREQRKKQQENGAEGIRDSVTPMNIQITKPRVISGTAPKGCQAIYLPKDEGKKGGKEEKKEKPLEKKGKPRQKDMDKENMYPNTRKAKSHLPHCS